MYRMRVRGYIAILLLILSGPAWSQSPGASPLGSQKVAPPSMKLGINLWNKGWSPSDTYFRQDILPPPGRASGGRLAWADAVLIANPATGSLANFNPWQAQFLQDLKSFNGPIRFMDFDSANTNPIVKWSDRWKMTDSQYDANLRYDQKTPEMTLTIDPTILAHTNFYNGGTTWIGSCLAYEWMIDLCNRTGRDLWINVPTFANRDYRLKLATLIRDNLRPGLKVYVEWSNEFWNWISVANAYSYWAGPALGLPGDNQWYQGGAWCVWQALQCFKDFQEVFGVANTGIGKRLVRVLAESGNQDIAYEALAKVVFTSDRDRRFNQTWNPMGQQPDVLAIAPYIGPHDDAANFDQLRTTGTELSPLPKLDGAAPNIAVRYRANIDYCISQYVKKWAEVATAFGLPLIAYEGGQQLDTNAGSWSANPAIQAEYVYFLRQLQAAGIGLYCHYTLYGVYTPGEAWGLIAAPQGNPAAAYPKFRAIREWMGAFWGPGPY